MVYSNMRRDYKLWDCHSPEGHQGLPWASWIATGVPASSVAVPGVPEALAGAAVPVCVAVEVEVGLGVAVEVAVEVEVDVGVGHGVDDGVIVNVGAGVPVGTVVAEGVGDGRPKMTPSSWEE